MKFAVMEKGTHDTESFGGMLYRISHHDEDLEQWKDRENESYSRIGAAYGDV